MSEHVNVPAAWMEVSVKRFLSFTTKPEIFTRRIEDSGNSSILAQVEAGKLASDLPDLPSHGSFTELPTALMRQTHSSDLKTSGRTTLRNLVLGKCLWPSR